MTEIDIIEPAGTVEVVEVGGSLTGTPPVDVKQGAVEVVAFDVGHVHVELAGTASGVTGALAPSEVIVPTPRDPEITLGQQGPPGPPGSPGDPGEPGAAVFRSLEQPPADPVNGEFYWDTTLEVVRVWNAAAGAWEDFGAADPVDPPLDFRYVHAQAIASAEWVVHHDLGGYPSVTVVDSAGDVVIGDVRYVSNAEIRVSFTNAFGGNVYLS